jgi:hypothetical protein
MFAMLAPAQTPDPASMDKLKVEMERMVAQSKVIGLAGSVMNSTVKGAPYSAIEVTESTQMLADGTRIHNESQTKVYRDNEGRVRRETPDQVTIMDPVAGATYILDPKSQTVHKVGLSARNTFVYRKGVGVGAGAGAGTNSTFEVRSDNGVTSVMIDGKPANPETIAQMKAHAELAVEPMMIETFPRLRVQAGAPGSDTVVMKKIEKSAGQSESLGKQAIEGIQSEGTRTTATLPAGSIGNDRPIQTITERWYSPELQTVMMSKHSDPRAGEDTFRLINVIRAEPGPDLFQVPPSYHTVEKM